jgi:branched-chain amino acid transport system substrate-binding protein
VRARWLSLAALTAIAPAAAGCGGVGVSGASEVTGKQLAIYSSLPLQGPAATISQQIVNGERLALAYAGGHIGPFTITYSSLDDSNPASGAIDPGATASDAKTAAQDTDTIAYLGEYNSAATAVSLPLINAAGILQVSPASPYVGLTSSLDAGQDEPQRFYPSGQRTFARLQPGDPAQASAQAQLMKALGVRKLYVLDDQDPFQVPLAQIVAADAEREGILVAAHDGVSTSSGGGFAGEVQKIVESGAQAVFFAGDGGAGTVALWQQLHSADPHLLLLGTSAMAIPSLASQLGAASASTYLTTPMLATAQYPPAAARVLADYRRHFGLDASPYALYGFESMSAVLDAIRKAGARGNNRQAVIDAFFATRDRNSVLGRYSVGAEGETSPARYGVDRVVNARLAPWRVLAVP